MAANPIPACARQNLQRLRQCPKFGKVTIAWRPTRSISLTMASVLRICLQRLRQDDVIEGAGIESGQATLQIALDDVHAVA
jgi:hypothetical protein